MVISTCCPTFREESWVSLKLASTQALGVTGLVITKLDGTAKGGILLAIARRLRIPVRYLGVGEASDQLIPFDAESFTDALLGSPAT